MARRTCGKKHKNKIAILRLATMPMTCSALALPLALAGKATANDVYIWTGSNDTWTQNTGWFRTADFLPYSDPPDGSPTQAVVGHDDGVYILGNSNETANLNFNYTLGMTELDIDSNDTVNEALSADNMAAVTENIGMGGAGTYTQSAATNKVTSALVIGDGSGGGAGGGDYNLSGGALTLTGSASAYVGYSDGGLLTQTGGTTTIGGSLYIADFASNTGSYQFNYGGGTGSLSVTGTEYVGLFGSGNFYQGAGTNQAGGLVIAANSGSAGYYELDAGTLSTSGITLNSGGTYNQFGGTLKFTTFTQAGGSSFFATGITVANSTYNLQSGTMTLTGTATLSSGGTFHQSGGSLSFLTFNQSGGTANFDNGLTGGASYSLSGGSLTAPSISGPTLSWTGGTLTLTSQGFNVSGSATDPNEGGFDYGSSLTITSGMTLNANLYEWLFGTGTSITQNGGANTTPELIMGSTGTSAVAVQYNLSSGSLSVSNTAYVGVLADYSGPATANFTQTGGTASFQTLDIAYSGGASTYSLSAGTVSVSGSINLYTAGVLHQSGGTLTFPVLNVAGGAASFDNGLNLTSSTVTLSSGSLATPSVTGSLANLHWTGGTFTLSSQAFVVGTHSDTAYGGLVWGSSLTLNSGMSLNETGEWEQVFGSGSTITQNNGSSNSTTYLYAGSDGTGASPVHYTLAGGTLTVSNTAFLGYVDPAYSAPGAATFTQSNGTSSFGSLALGGSGTITATLSAGTMSVSGNMSLSNGSTFHQSGGSLSFGTFNQTGGTSNFDVGISIASSTVNLSGGSLTTSSFTLSGATPNMNWTGGSLTLTNQSVDFGAPGSDPANHAIIFGNSLTLNSGMSLNLSSAAKSEWLFGNGTTVTQNTGSSNIMYVFHMGATGTNAAPDQYNLTGGILIAIDSADVGYATGYPTTGSGAAVFTQTGGNADFATLNVGQSGSGTYNLSSGTLQVLGSVNVYSGGVFHQSGGATSGGGSILLPNFNQSGGSVTFDSGINLTTSSYMLSGGTLMTPSITAGTVGPSNLVWTGGSLTLTGQQFDITNGTDPINSGFIYANSLTLNSGMSLSVPNAAEVIYGNGSVVTQNANTTNSTEELVIAATGGANATADQYNLNGGTLSTTHDMYVGEVTIYGGPGSGAFIQSTGNVNVGGTLYMGIGGAPSQYQLNGQGSLTVTNTIDMRTGSTLQMGTDAGTITASSISNQGSIQMNGGSLTVSNTTTNNSSYSQTGGTATLGALSGSGTVNVAVPSANSTALLVVSQVTQNSLTVGRNGLVQIEYNSNFANSLNSVSVTSTGFFDITNNHIFINYGSNPDPIASIAALLRTGYSGGVWQGQGGIGSSAATGNASYGVGYADSADTGNPAHLSSGQIEIKYTLLGDADLSGVVDGVDFGIVAANFNKGVSRWDQGDFNYDNVVDGTDFGDLAANFNKGANGASVGPGALSDPALVAFAQANGLMADVPEPISLGILTLTTAGLLTQRRRRVLRKPAFEKIFAK